MSPVSLNRAARRTPRQPVSECQPAHRDAGTSESAASPVAIAVTIAPGPQKLCLRYLRRRAPERLAALKEIPLRIAFCWTAAAVRPSFLAT